MVIKRNITIIVMCIAAQLPLSPSPKINIKRNNKTKQTTECFFENPGILLIAPSVK
jgi:hypothetical protein